MWLQTETSLAVFKLGRAYFGHVYKRRHGILTDDLTVSVYINAEILRE